MVILLIDHHASTSVFHDGKTLEEKLLVGFQSSPSLFHGICHLWDHAVTANMFGKVTIAITYILDLDISLIFKVLIFCRMLDVFMLFR